MNDFLSASAAERAQIIIENVLAKLGDEAPAHLNRGWIFEGKVAVLDYQIANSEIAFDLSVVDDHTLRVETFARSPDARLRLPGLRLENTSPARFLVMEVDCSSDPIWSRVASSLLQVLRDLAAALSSDAILLESVGAAASLTVVDVGANDIYEPPYLPLRRLGRCKIVGFEPHREAFEDLQSKQTLDAQYFPFAVGAPGPIDLRVYNYSGFTSAFRIDEDTIGMAPHWFSGTRLRETISLDCVALDDVPDLPAFDLLKIDIQGGELEVFRHAKRALKAALCIITEVSFFPLYEKAPSFADVHQELAAQGFLLHKFMTQERIGVDNLSSDGGRVNKSQLIDGDAVYLRDFRRLETLGVAELRKIALLAHFVFSSPDLAVRMLGELARRGEAPEGLVETYVSALD